MQLSFVHKITAAIIFSGVVTTSIAVPLAKHFANKANVAKPIVPKPIIDTQYVYVYGFQYSAETNKADSINHESKNYHCQKTDSQTSAIETFDCDLFNLTDDEKKQHKLGTVISDGTRPSDDDLSKENNFFQIKLDQTNWQKIQTNNGDLISKIEVINKHDNKKYITLFTWFAIYNKQKIGKTNYFIVTTTNMSQNETFQTPANFSCLFNGESNNVHWMNSTADIIMFSSEETNDSYETLTFKKPVNYSSKPITIKNNQYYLIQFDVSSTKNLKDFNKTTMTCYKDNKKIEFKNVILAYYYYEYDHIFILQ